MFQLSLLSIALTIFCIIHIIRSGADRIWIYVVILLPTLGPIAYLVAEIVPAMIGGTRARKLATGAVRTMDPGRDIRRRMADLEVLDSAENRRLLAEEHMKLGQFHEAGGILRSALVGIHSDDRALLLALARASSGAGDDAGAIEALDRLREADPDFQSSDAHLIYARSLQNLGRDQEALDELSTLVTYATGEEARCRYAIQLRKAGRVVEARQVFEEILARARRANRRYRANEHEWIETARREVGSTA